MAIKFTSNRRLHDRNSKAVDTATKRINQVAPLAQERYQNAFKVNGFPCVVYNKLQAGRRCSCTQATRTDFINPILDENGNASQQHIQEMLTGSSFEIMDYATTRPTDPTGIKTKRFTVDREYSENPAFNTVAQEDIPLATDLDAELNMLVPEHNPNMLSTSKCGICYGSGFVGGFSVHNGNRIVLDTTWANLDQFGVTIAQEATPHAFQFFDENAYVDFTTVLPFGATKVDCLRVWNNAEQLSAVVQIGTNTTNLITLTEQTLVQYTTGVPVVIRVSGVAKFTHLEIQFNLSDYDTYLEYPRLSRTGDLSVLDAIDNVQIYVSPLVLSLNPWDIIFDTINRKAWRVLNTTDFKDRNRNLHGWDVSARLVQDYELYKYLTGRINVSQNLATHLPRF